MQAVLPLLLLADVALSLDMIDEAISRAAKEATTAAEATDAFGMGPLELRPCSRKKSSLL